MSRKTVSDRLGKAADLIDEETRIAVQLAGSDCYIKEIAYELTSNLLIVRLGQKDDYTQD